MPSNIGMWCFTQSQAHLSQKFTKAMDYECLWRKCFLVAWNLCQMNMTTFGLFTKLMYMLHTDQFSTKMSQKWPQNCPLNDCFTHCEVILYNTQAHAFEYCVTKLKQSMRWWSITNATDLQNGCNFFIPPPPPINSLNQFLRFCGFRSSSLKRFFVTI